MSSSSRRGVRQMAKLAINTLKYREDLILEGSSRGVRVEKSITGRIYGDKKNLLAGYSPHQRKIPLGENGTWIYLEGKPDYIYAEPFEDGSMGAVFVEIKSCQNEGCVPYMTELALAQAQFYGLLYEDKLSPKRVEVVVAKPWHRGRYTIWTAFSAEYDKELALGYLSKAYDIYREQLRSRSSEKRQARAEKFEEENFLREEINSLGY
jgi:hypothetical protein